MASADDIPGTPDPLAEERVRLCRCLVRERARVGIHLGFDLCPSPAWDVLLDLYLAHEEGRVVQIWSLCIAANIPTSTAHRKISGMVKSGVLTRGHRGGRVTVALAPAILAKVEALLDDLARFSGGTMRNLGICGLDGT